MPLNLLRMAVAKFLYLVPNYDLLSYIANFFTTSRRAIYFGLYPEFFNRRLEMPLRGAKPGPLSTLSDVLWASSANTREAGRRSD
jgi:hypothetical protein